MLHTCLAFQAARDMAPHIVIVGAGGAKRTHARTPSRALARTAPLPAPGSRSFPRGLMPCASTGVGCWVYACIADAVRRDPALARVTIVARGAAYERLHDHGLKFLVRSAAPPVEGASTPAGDGDPARTVVLGPDAVRVVPTCATLQEQGVVADYVILCVKTWQVADAARQAACLLRPGTGCLVTTQNGVAAPIEATEATGSESAVMVGIAKVIAFREDDQARCIPDSGALRCVRLGAPSPRTIMLGEYGAVRQSQSEQESQLPQKRTLGSDASEAGACVSCESERVSRLRNILRTSGIEVPEPEGGNIKRELWRKATMMCCMGPMSAVTRADIHTMLKTPATRDMLRAAMEEVCALSARLPGCYVGDGWADQTMTYLEPIKAGSTPSTVRDVVCGRPSEVREMSGAMHRLGLEYGVPMPVHSFIAAVMEPQEALARGEREYFLQGVPGGRPNCKSGK